ncbi:MAG: DUF481 domain-containing protein [Planctomycetales bacterium]|nr:DUF481 domain-containing protein [Planctomycetales bacterium]
MNHVTPRIWIAVWFAFVLPRTIVAQTEDLELLPPVEVTESQVLGEEPVFLPNEPNWTRPTTWFASPLWDFTYELGINGSTGNAEALSILTSANLKKETDLTALTMGLTYAKTQAQGVETQHYAIFNSRWDYKVNDRWFFYNKNTIEYDEFKAFDLRLVLSGGLGYHLIKNDHTTLTGRLGSGVSREFGGPDEDWIPEANFGADFEHKLTERQKVAATVDYYPEWSNFADYRLVTNAYWELLLDGEHNLSLKVGVIDRYDSTPNGRKPNDVDYFLTLLWKM